MYPLRDCTKKGIPLLAFAIMCNLNLIMRKHWKKENIGNAESSESIDSCMKKNRISYISSPWKVGVVVSHHGSYNLKT